MAIDPASSEAIREAAAIWFARMRRPDADQFKPEFDIWLAESGDHRTAYNRMAETFSLGKNLTSNLGLNNPVAEPQRPSARRGELILVACSILLGSGFAAALWNERFGALGTRQVSALPAAPAGVELATGEDQLRSIRLNDGSWVTLDANSQVTATISSDARTLQLVRGRARFRVAHDGRPFIVSAGMGSVIARGTVFDVALHERGELSVELLQGSVDVVTRSAARADAPVIRTQKLTPGHRLMVSLQKDVSPIGRLSHDGWIEAPIDFDNARLADVVAQANFGAPRPIRVADASVGDLRVSGTFRIGDTRQLAQRLATLFGLNADESAQSEILLRPQSMAAPKNF